MKGEIDIKDDFLDSILRNKRETEDISRNKDVSSLLDTKAKETEGKKCASIE